MDFPQGVESLPLRMAKHSENALRVAEFLKKHPKVEWVRYPGLPDDPSWPIASKYMKNGFGGMVVFGVRGGSAEAMKLVDNIRLFSILANVGDAKSLIIHPASTTHSQLSDEAQREARASAGIAPPVPSGWSILMISSPLWVMHWL